MDGNGEPIEILNRGEITGSDNLVAKMNAGNEAEKKMEGTSSGTAVEVDRSGEEFLCVICLELVYKPIVHACGHVFCFWCVHEAMSCVGVSRCPLCRSPYKHFPRICELLHFFLLKAFPEDYRQREEQVLEQERQREIFSPQFNDAKIANTGSKLDTTEFSESFSEGESSQGDSFPGFGIARKCTDMLYSADRRNNGCESMHTSLCHHRSANVKTAVEFNNPEVNSVLEASETQKCQANVSSLMAYNKVTVDDVLCCFCKELLYRPTVLNCGHAFCESCISDSEEGKLKCRVCQSLHPSFRPNVILELHHYLERVFSVEYAQRKKSVLIQQEMCQQPKEDCTACTKERGRATAEMPQSQWQARIIHYAGCDSCGMMPIIGRRYKCQDCHELIGFDLCETCYEAGSRLPGRFNQQHTADHCFKPEVDLNTLVPHLISPFPWINPIAIIPEEQQSNEGSMVYIESRAASEDSTESSENPDRNHSETEEDDSNSSLVFHQLV
eukprot:Gb_06840 [translate_table: standard]